MSLKIRFFYEFKSLKYGKLICKTRMIMHEAISWEMNHNRDGPCIIGPTQKTASTNVAQLKK